MTSSAVLGSTLSSSAASDKTAQPYDVCVYGGTASGVVAAVAAAREGCRVLLVEPSRWLGGMTGGGLVHIDWGRREAVGGTALMILKDGRNDPYYRQAFQALVKEHSVAVIYEHRIQSTKREGSILRSIVLDFAPPDRFGCPAPKAITSAAITVQARIFVDCSYEGDLMARSGVSYTFGRESREEYGESLAGVRPNLAVYAIDPYLKAGDPKSGLLPLLQDFTIGPLGSADKLTMGYGFRWKFSTASERLPIPPPDDYDPRTFELYRRGFAGQVKMDQGRCMRTLGEYQVEEGNMYKPGQGNLSRCLWAATVFGSNADYPDGDYATRARIWKGQQDFLRGITHFLRTEPAVPPALKRQAEGVGFTPGIFDDTAGWPHQLYVREARRMKSGYVLTQKDLAGETNPDHSVGLASYGVDDWSYATIPYEGGVALQGGEFSKLYLTERHQGIYKLPYEAITPLKSQSENLLVPVCCSASHVAMTSIRMEPTWMILSESAGVAASIAIKERSPVQTIDYQALRAKLLALGQKLEPPS